jgi:FAD/FMN-containing dehydrogenase
MSLVQDPVLKDLLSYLDKEVVLTGDELTGRYCHIWHTEVQLQAKALLLPRSTAEVSAICRICNAHNQSMVVHGGLTGLVGGTVSRPSDIAISLQRMNGIEEVDPLCRSMTVQAGCILASVHQAADAHGLFFPLNFGAKGSAHIGGCIATNAGGLRVKRFGMTRNLILGLEVVLADGTILNGLKKIIKDNTGYNLNQLFIGSEGTLGIVTRATLRLEEKLHNRNSVFVGLADFKDAIRLLRFCDAKFSGLLSAFEILWANTFEALTSRLQSPFREKHTYYVLLEVLDNHAPAFKNVIQDVFTEAFEKNLIQDAVFADTAQDQALFWGIREDVELLNSMSPYQQHFDVSVPIDQMADYAEQVIRQLSQVEGVVHSFCFGHMADGNLHFIVGKNTPDASVKSRVNEILYTPLRAIRGSVSAEHGIGLEKKEWLGLCKPESEIKLMKKIKDAFDPKKLLNPAKIID